MPLKLSYHESHQEGIDIMAQERVNEKHPWGKFSPQQIWISGSSSRKDVHHLKLRRISPSFEFIEMAGLIWDMQSLSYMASSQDAMSTINGKMN